MTLPCDSRLSARSHIMSKASLHCAMRAHRVVDATAAEPTLREHLRAIFGAEQMVERHADVVVDDVVVVARLGHDLDAGCLAGDDEHAVRAHHEQQVCDPAGAREPLLAVDHPLVAVTDGMRLEEVRV